MCTDKNDSLLASSSQFEWWGIQISRYFEHLLSARVFLRSFKVVKYLTKISVLQRRVPKVTSDFQMSFLGGPNFVQVHLFSYSFSSSRCSRWASSSPMVSTYSWRLGNPSQQVRLSGKEVPANNRAWTTPFGHILDFATLPSIFEYLPKLAILYNVNIQNPTYRVKVAFYINAHFLAHF